MLQHRVVCATGLMLWCSIIWMASQLDFVHLRGIANHVHEAVKQDTWNFYHVSLML